jgi:hypothetical protein
MTDTPTNPAAVVEQVDRDAFQTLPFNADSADIIYLLARHRLLGIEQGRAEMREEAAEDFRWRERHCRTNPDAFDTAAAAIWAFAAEAMESSK